MYVLGIYCGHNSTALLMKDGNVIAAASEERFNGIKNFIGFPKNAINYVLEEAKIKNDDINLVTFSHRMSVPISFVKFNNNDKPFSIIILGLLSYPLIFVRRFWGILEYYFPNFRFLGRYAYKICATSVGIYSGIKEKQYLSNTLKIKKEKIKMFDHHLSHAASGYYASPFSKKKALVLTLDGEGDMLCGSVNVFEKEKIKTITKIPRDNSLGYLYASVTSFLGMQPNEHEYKVMGLAAYVKPDSIKKLYSKIENIIQIDKDRLTINSLYNTVGFINFLKKNMQMTRFDLIAAVFQKLLEDKISLWVKYSIKKTGIHTVVLSGGVFMNVKVNQQIANIPELKELFIIPSSSDESSILGSSYLAYIQECNLKKITPKIIPIKNIYWGKETSDKEILGEFRKINAYKKFYIKRIDNIETKIAELLSSGNIVARVSGRMEFGARALGNRSILADARNYDVVRIINEKVKNRDFWMPFAPSILFERQKDYIKNPKFFSAYYMMQSFDTQKKARIDLRAAIHPYDFTVRPQLVTKEYNPRYYKILKEFEKLTGVGGILNTSFNIHGYPIVLGPKEALRAFSNSGLEYLAIENYLVSKNKFFN